MEDDLDRIASGEQDRNEWLHRFYFGDETTTARACRSSSRTSARSTRARSTRSELGNGIVVRVGRYGPYLERDEQRANVPDDVVPDELTVEKAEELLAQPSGDRELGVDPETGREIVARTGRYGPYVTEALEEGSKEKPRTASLFKSMALDTITLDEALQLLSLPRVVGVGDGRRGGDGAERPLRPVRAAGEGVALARDARSSSSRSTLEEALALARAAAAAARRPPGGAAAEGGRRPTR